METLYLAALFCLISFAALAMIDGFYLHIWKYRLYLHKESEVEHFMHTLRAIIFPGIVYFFFLQSNNNAAFTVGLILVGLDILVLVADAYLEKDSRVFMGGLPRWEYILHLFANGFHFAAIILFLVVKTSVTSSALIIIPTVSSGIFHDIFFELVKQILPGSIGLAIIHVAVMLTPFQQMFHRFQQCCGNHTTVSENS